MYRSSFRLSTSPARRRMSRWWDRVGPGISTASWISPTDSAFPAFTRTKKTWSRLRCARALKASTWLSRPTTEPAAGARSPSYFEVDGNVESLSTPAVVLPGEHARLKGAQAAREHEAERADQREGRVHLRRAQHLPVAIDQMAEA